MIRLEPWHYTDVPRMGTVLFSTDALTSIHRACIRQWDLEKTLELGTDTKDPDVPRKGHREHNGVRLVFKTWPHLKGAAVVCVDGYRVKS
jgi:hypothetical protein